MTSRRVGLAAGLRNSTCCSLPASLFLPLSACPSLPVLPASLSLLLFDSDSASALGRAKHELGSLAWWQIHVEYYSQFESAPKVTGWELYSIDLHYIYTHMFIHITTFLCLYLEVQLIPPRKKFKFIYLQIFLLNIVTIRIPVNISNLQ